MLVSSSTPLQEKKPEFLKELLHELAIRVKEDEPGAEKFEFFEHLNPETGRNLYLLKRFTASKL
ncbi:hypothetical protein BGAL_0132g00070 [Botrytis galanthina]|uniref:ABM domain-containing protein n=1 Tax=Botrytis galanthina TaxID=278940 RepID=A0A4S8R419_9HELO|nr:hypothetical protein BGAL_0132g00070 [Botrytis galanthina]